MFVNLIGLVGLFLIGLALRDYLSGFPGPAPGTRGLKDVDVLFFFIGCILILCYVGIVNSKIFYYVSKSMF